MILTIIILSFMVVILGFTTINLLFKNEKMEDVLLSYKEYMTQVSEAIEHSSNKLKEIDERDVFKSDDEIGWFFEKIKLIQDILNQYKIKNS
jgi:hypothetical protein